jgi:putative toxin-antitoxin system antitoxin component (TIGR02293 family)
MERKEDNNIVSEAAVEYRKTGRLSTGNRNVIMSWVRGGIEFDMFQNMISKFPFSIEEWSGFLHLSERTLQRYKKESKNFDSLQSEKIIQISMLYQRGVEVFGSQENFDAWLNSLNIALGNVKPKELLDNAFGIALLDEELTRIEHGVLA